jgi:hypothetical protein
VKRIAAGIAILSVSMLSGCGYSSEGLFRSGIQTVHVEIFESKEFRRDLEFYLTEAVKKRIATDSPYRVASKEKADTILKGEILEERQAAFAPDFATRLPRDKQLNLVVRVEWKDLRSGQVLLDQPLLLSSADYLPPAGETEEYGQRIAIDRLAAKIVARMYDDW